MTSPLHPDGVRRLAAAIIEQCIAAACYDPDQIDVAVSWATWCGEDDELAREKITKRVQAGDVPPLRQVDQADYEARQRAAIHDWHYNEGKRCPYCGVPITNNARTCWRHKWYK
jgi:alkanesulfonate monooxygenase SsuD/methylene tetrahydromethanopterin reductase-like flavin-dependent oxidoreductase (luciferase family)